MNGSYMYSNKIRIWEGYVNPMSNVMSIILKELLGNASLTYEEMSKIQTQIEAIPNSPL